MPTSKSAKKRLKTNEKARMRNKAKQSKLKTLEKNLIASVDAKDKDAAEKIVKGIHSALDKAAKSGVIHGNKASRKKARLDKMVAGI